MVKLIVIVLAFIILYATGGVSALVGVAIGIAIGCSFATRWYDKTGLLRPQRVIRVGRKH